MLMTNVHNYETEFVFEVIGSNEKAVTGKSLKQEKTDEREYVLPRRKQFLATHM
jgi:hypothetical protein